HRPGIVPAAGLRAGADRTAMLRQTGSFEQETWSDGSEVLVHTPACIPLRNARGSDSLPGVGHLGRIVSLLRVTGGRSRRGSLPGPADQFLALATGGSQSDLPPGGCASFGKARPLPTGCGLGAR